MRRSTLFLILPFLPLAFWCFPVPAAEFNSAWPEGIERCWIGPEYFSNRHIDWRVRDGRLECLMGTIQKPMRTVHLLTRALGEGEGTLEMSVRTGPMESGGEQHANTWTGFLLGVGGAHVDFRISALCHHWPSTDGGLIAAIDGTGKTVFRDNSTPDSRNPKEPDDWPSIEPTTSEGRGFQDGPVEDITLTLEVTPNQGSYQLILTAKDSKNGDIISRSAVEGIDPQQVSGNVALVSHSSPRGKGAGYWFRDWKVAGSKAESHEDRAFGPVLAAQHTLSRGVLKMTAQMGPLGDRDTQTAQLQIRRTPDGPWETAAEGSLIKHSYTIPFRVENWDSTRDTPYRIAYDLKTGPDSTETHFYEGTIRKEPTDRDTFVVAAFTGHHISAQGDGRWNQDAIWYPHNELVAAVKYHKPDLLFFSGDQIYEGGLEGIIREPEDLAAVDYLYHWVRWCWAFRDLARDVPCICIPDDHDVYHGNLWGAGGRHAERQDDGGYTMSPLFVNAVQTTQTSHLPDPYDPTPVEQGITVYYTRMDYAGLSFAILEDRKWKSSPTVMVPEGDCVNGWFHNPQFDPATQADMPGAVLLGERQLDFLRDWAADWSNGIWMKVALSQTLFANVATIPGEATNDKVVPKMRYADKGEYIEGDHLAADADSNGWPQSGRNQALREIRKAFALHIAGDQHLGSFTQYGIDDWGDASYAFCVPSIANVWPRRWFPPQPGANRKEGAPAYTGDFKDGFGNRVTVYAVSNPARSGHKPEALYDRAPGYGIVRFDRNTRQIEVECWPRWIDPSKLGAQEYPGWPIAVNQSDNYGRNARFFLPPLEVSGMEDPVVQVAAEPSNEVVYTLRIRGRRFEARVLEEGTYSIKVGEPGTERGRTLTGLQSTQERGGEPIRVVFR